MGVNPTTKRVRSRLILIATLCDIDFVVAS